ncbi:MAG TPA: hypothetical protein VMZ53_03950 [Kofleriaceae bacterium]|nr:hypothetical protein [Kofleriaceae bacterium]
MRRGWFAFVLLVGCGDVNKAAPDAPAPDAYEPDAPMACTGGQMLCMGGCEDVMTSTAHCGSCDKQCGALERCAAGTCKPFDSCADYKAVNAMLANGIYQSTAKVDSFYCDFTNGQQYDFTLHDFTMMPEADYALMRATDFANTTTAAAFIALYNQRGGMRPYKAWTSGNCCWSTTGGVRLAWNGSIMFSFQNGSSACGAYNPASVWQFGQGVSTAAPLPLPANFFTTNTITETAGCGDANNPGIWMRKKAI